MLREPLIWLFACGIIGYFIGRLKGLGKPGFFLGLLFGPIGWGIVIMLPNVKAAQREASAGQDPVCTRCGKPVDRKEKACPYCGNVLVPIKYRVDGDANP